MAFQLATGTASFAARCVDRLEPDRNRISALVEQSLMLVTALSPAIGYDKAAVIAKRAYTDGITLRAAALASGLVDQATFDRLVRPEAMIGSSSSAKSIKSHSRGNPDA